jgi:hypothetical protein
MSETLDFDPDACARSTAKRLAAGPEAKSITADFRHHIDDPHAIPASPESP